MVIMKIGHMESLTDDEDVSKYSEPTCKLGLFRTKKSTIKLRNTVLAYSAINLLAVSVNSSIKTLQTVKFLPLYLHL